MSVTRARLKAAASVRETASNSPPRIDGFGDTGVDQIRSFYYVFIIVIITCQQNFVYHRSSANDSLTIRNALLLGGKTVKNVLINPQTAEIWPTDLNVTLSASESVSNTLVRT